MGKHIAKNKYLRQQKADLSEAICAHCGQSGKLKYKIVNYAAVVVCECQDRLVKQMTAANDLAEWARKERQNGRPAA